MLGGEGGRLPRRGPFDHQARARDDSTDVRLDDSAVDAGVDAEVVGVDDQPLHAASAVSSSSARTLSESKNSTAIARAAFACRAYELPICAIASTASAWDPKAKSPSP